MLWDFSSGRTNKNKTGGRNVRNVHRTIGRGAIVTRIEILRISRTALGTYGTALGWVQTATVHKILRNIFRHIITAEKIDSQWQETDWMIQSNSEYNFANVVADRFRMCVFKKSRASWLSWNPWLRRIKRFDGTLRTIWTLQVNLASLKRLTIIPRTSLVESNLFKVFCKRNWNIKGWALGILKDSFNCPNEHQRRRENGQWRKD